MIRKWMGILLSGCIVLGGFMANGTVACAYDHGDESEYIDQALFDRWERTVEKCLEIDSLYMNGTIGVITEDGEIFSQNPEATVYLVSESEDKAFWEAWKTYLEDWFWFGPIDNNHYMWDEDINGVPNWNEDGYLTSIKRSKMKEAIHSLDEAAKPMWDQMHPRKSEGSKAEKEEEALEEAERLKAEEERKALEEASRGSVRLEKEAAENGFANGAQLQDAKGKGKSADEYYNNAVVDTPGIENPVPVAQGGKLVVDGKTTNMTATIEKVSSVYVDSIRAARQGTVLNVVKVNYPAAEAVITFYMPGVQAGDTIMASQYEGGLWTDVEVTEVRADHVTLSLKGNGVVAFLK